MANKYISVTGVIFGLVAAAHLARAVGAIPIQFGDFTVIPVWASWVAAVVAAALCVWAFWSRS